jgi:E3 ubiquitin-protein ligase DOA10
MTHLHEWLAEQSKKHCDLCAASLMLNVITIGLMLVLQAGPGE